MMGAAMSVMTVANIMGGSRKSGSVRKTPESDRIAAPANVPMCLYEWVDLSDLREGLVVALWVRDSIGPADIVYRLRERSGMMHTLRSWYPPDLSPKDLRNWALSEGATMFLDKVSQQ